MRREKHIAKGKTDNRDYVSTERFCSTRDTINAVETTSHRFRIDTAAKDRDQKMQEHPGKNENKTKWGNGPRTEIENPQNKICK